MISTRSFFLHTVVLVLCATLALATLRNVTVDDSVLTGAVVPSYLPSAGAWNQGNACNTCGAHPDPAMAYNGTWHDGSSFTQSSGPSLLSFEFSFIGSAVYIYFILPAINELLQTAATSVNFTLDGVTHPPYIYIPTSGAGYQYHVPVFANSSLPSGTHTMTVNPVVPTTAPNYSVLVLFDYLVYTTDTDDVITPSSTPGSPPSSTPPKSSGRASVHNIGAIVGGTVAGVIALVVVTASLLCYRRHKRRAGRLSPINEPILIDPVPSPQMTPYIESSALPISRSTVGFSPIETGTRSSTGTPPLTVRSKTPAATSNVSGAASSNANALMEQIGLLRDEVSRIREHQVQDQHLAEFGREPPPGYSEGSLL